MLTATRNKSEHRFALQELVRRGSVRGHQTARGQAQEGRGWGEWCGHWIRGFGGLGLGVGGGLWSGFHPPRACLPVLLPPLTLLSPHQLFTSGYTKGNPGALIVAERNSSPSYSPTRSFFFFFPYSFFLTAHLLPPPNFH